MLLYVASRGPEKVPVMNTNPLYIPFERLPWKTPVLQLRVPPMSALAVKKTAPVLLKLPEAAAI